MPGPVARIAWPASAPTSTGRKAFGRRRRLVLAGLELATGAAAVFGGALLIAVPDGSLLQADLTVLSGSPFTDWRWPGVLLAALVGGGFLTAGVWQMRRGRYSDELSMFAGLGLVVFELAEFGWIGFQPLEALFAAVGATVFVLAFSGRRRRDVAGDHEMKKHRD